MKREPLYSRADNRRSGSPLPRATGALATAPQTPPAAAVAAEAAENPVAPKRRWRPKGERVLLAMMAVCLAVTAGALFWQVRHKPFQLTQKDIDAAVLHTLRPSRCRRWPRRAEKILPSVVRVRGLGENGRRATARRTRNSASAPAWSSSTRASSSPTCTSSPASKRIKVVLRRPAKVRRDRGRRCSRRTTSPCSRRTKVPTTCAGDAALDAGPAPGDEVVAVGFPFGIGPSASAGVVSGLQARVPLAAGQARADEPDPVRRGGEPRQLGRAAGDRGRRSRRHRHRDPQSRPSSACSSASASPCRSRTPPRRSACRRSDFSSLTLRFTLTGRHLHGSCRDQDQQRCRRADGAHPLRGQEGRRRPGPLPRARAGRDRSRRATCWSRACRGSRRR